MVSYSFPQNKEDTIENGRIILVTIIILICFFIVTARLFFLQIIRGDQFRGLSEDNRIRLVRLKAIRGLMLDRHNQVLVKNRPYFKLSIIPEEVQDMNKILASISRLIDIPIDQMKKTIKESPLRSFEEITLKRDLTFEEVAKLEERQNSLPGIVVNAEAKRYYPYETFAAHLFGYMGEVNPQQLKSGKFLKVRRGDEIGQYGLENIGNNYLIGDDGGKQVEVDVEGRELEILGHLPSVPGNNLILTIDLDLQLLVEEALEGKTGAIVVMDPRNGEILAMASHPCFNPNDFATGISLDKWNQLLDDPKDPLQNRTIQAQYPPGSIFKIIMASAGLETDAIDEHSEFLCTGQIKIGNWTYDCWKKGGHGKRSIHYAIVHSCNVFFYQLGSKLGIDTIAQYARTFGFDSPTQINLKGEKPGLIPDPEWKKNTLKTVWYPGETISASIGQGYILVTPIQLACFISAIANYGNLYSPQIIKAITTPEKKVIKSFPPGKPRKIPISSKNLKIIRQALWGVVNEHGTGHRAKIPGVGVSGKTGTAQIVRQEDDRDNSEKEEIPEELRDHAWFICFAPFENPTIAVVVLVEHGGHGGAACAPLAKKIIQGYLSKYQKNES
ncbi:MAG: penicillin-binding protein 2 [bacterium]